MIESEWSSIKRTRYYFARWLTAPHTSHAGFCGVLFACEGESVAESLVRCCGEAGVPSSETVPRVWGAFGQVKLMNQGTTNFLLSTNGKEATRPFRNMQILLERRLRTPSVCLIFQIQLLVLPTQQELNRFSNVSQLAKEKWLAAWCAEKHIR